MHACTHRHTSPKHTYAYIPTQMVTRVHRLECTQMHMGTQIYVGTNRTRRLTRTHTSTHTRTRTRTHMHAHTQTHTYIHSDEDSDEESEGMDDDQMFRMDDKIASYLRATMDKRQGGCGVHAVFAALGVCVCVHLCLCVEEKEPMQHGIYVGQRKGGLSNLQACLEPMCDQHCANCRRVNKKERTCLNSGIDVLIKSTYGGATLNTLHLILVVVKVPKKPQNLSRTCTSIHACTHAHACTYTQTHSHIHTHTHKHTPHRSKRSCCCSCSAQIQGFGVTGDVRPQGI